ncbi:MAG: choline dehydrogenase-like flavoprotein [Bradymonadia bacterium]
MLQDAREVVDAARIEADVCIVGAGAAGITLALSLREQGLAVVVLESGGAQSDAATQALYTGTMSGIDTWQLDGCRFRQLGGSTIAWAGWCRPLDAADFEPQAWMPNSGWPITRADLDPFYALAQGTLELADFEYDTTVLSGRAQRPLFNLDDSVVVTSVYHFSPPTRFGARYNADLAASEDVTVFLYANVLDLKVADGRIDQVDVGTLSGVRFSVNAQVTVLAAGGLENPRILLAANGGAGVANANDMVGRFFMEHPHYYSAAFVVTSTSETSFYERFTMPGSFAGDAVTMKLQGALAIAADVRAREGIPNMGLEITVGDIERDQAGVPPRQIAPLLRGDEPARLLRLNARVEQRPLADSRLTLKTERDALGIPKLDLRWQIAPEDLVGYRRGFELLGAAFGRGGLGRVWASVESDSFKGNPRPGCHHMGTTRMSADPARGVVDANLRSHEIENLYVLGSSVFVTGGYANPTLTIVALAHRLAVHLKEALA